MIYIENNNKATFSKTSKTLDIDRVVLTNQVTKQEYTIHATPVEGGNGKYFQVISLTLPRGSYDYIAYNDKEVIGCGILSNLDETTNGNTDYVAYRYREDIITYNPEEEVVTPNDYTIKIYRNGEYNVENYDLAIVNVFGGEGGEGCAEIVEGLQQEIDRLEDKNATLSQTNSNLNITNKQLQDDIQTLEGDIVVLTQENRILSQEVTNKNNTIQTLEEEKNTLQNDLSNANDTIVDLQEEIDTVTSITITKEGNYVAPEGTLGYNQITVEIVEDEPVEPEFVPEYLEIYGVTPSINNIFYISYVTDGTISPNFEYSRNGEDWFIWDYSEIEVVSRVYLRGVNNTRISDKNNYLYCIGESSKVSVGIRGNIMTLVDGEGRTKTIPDENMFAYLFKGFGDKFTDTSYPYSLVLRAKDLKLPATELTIGCYKYMFANTSLYYSYVPRVLPAKVLQYGCYEGMFENTNITIAPILLGEYLVGTENNTGCYARMFYNCKKLNRVYCFNKGWKMEIGDKNCPNKHHDTYEWMIDAGAEASDCYKDYNGTCYFVCRDELLCSWEGMKYINIPNDRCAFPVNWIVSPIDLTLFENLEIEDLL